VTTTFQSNIHTIILQDQFGDYTISSNPDETQHRQLTAYGRPSLRRHTPPDIWQLCTGLNHRVSHQ